MERGSREPQGCVSHEAGEWECAIAAEALIFFGDGRRRPVSWSQSGGVESLPDLGGNWPRAGIWPTEGGCDWASEVPGAGEVAGE